MPAAGHSSLSRRPHDPGQGLDASGGRLPATRDGRHGGSRPKFVPSSNARPRFAPVVSRRARSLRPVPLPMPATADLLYAEGRACPPTATGTGGIELRVPRRQLPLRRAVAQILNTAKALPDCARIEGRPRGCGARPDPETSSNYNNPAQLHEPKGYPTLAEWKPTNLTLRGTYYPLGRAGPLEAGPCGIGGGPVTERSSGELMTNRRNPCDDETPAKGIGRHIKQSACSD